MLALSGLGTTYGGITNAGTLYIDSGDLFLRSGAGLTQWTKNTSGHLLPHVDNTYDIGGASKRLRSVYAGNLILDQSTGTSTLVVGNAGNAGNTACAQIGATTSGLHVAGSNHEVRVIGTYPSSVPLRVMGSASHTGDLQRWTDNAGTTLAKINASGAATFNGGINQTSATHTLINIDTTGDSTKATGMLLKNGGSNKWQIYNASDKFKLYNYVLNQEAFTIDNSTSAAAFSGKVSIGTELNIYTAVDPQNGGVNATFITNTNVTRRMYFGTAAAPIYALNLGNVQRVENCPALTIGYMDFGAIAVGTSFGIARS